MTGPAAAAEAAGFPGAVRGVARDLRLSAADAAITVAVVAWALAEAVSIDGDAPVGWRVAFALAVSIPMAFRNRAPWAALAVAVVAFLADTLFQILPLFAVTPIQLLPLATYTVVSVADDRRAAGFAAFAAVAIPIALFVPLSNDAPVRATDIVSLLVIQTVASGAGWAVRLRREEADRQAARLKAARASADERLRASLDDERGRLARELRVIVARGVDALDRGLSAAAQAPAGELAVIAASLQRRSAAVMGELQRLLGVLHEASPGVALPMSPAGAAGEADGRGWRARVVEVAESAPGTTVAAGRIVEEVLAGRPAGPQAAAVDVRVMREGDGLRVRLSGAAPAPPALTDAVRRNSLRERARLHGGDLRVRRGPRRWAVDAHLPAVGSAAPRPSYLLGDAVVLGAAGLIVVDDARLVTSVEPWVLVLCETLAFIVPLALRRRFPLTAVLVIAGGLLGMQLAGVLPDQSRTAIIAALLGSGTAAMHLEDQRTALLATAAVAASAVITNLLQLPEGETYTDTPIILFMVVMAYAFGRLVRENVARTQHARDGQELVHERQRERLQTAIDDERRSVARDLHDVVAHGVSLVGVLAGAAQAQAQTDPVAARASLEAARGAIAQAGVEIGRLTAVLGGDADEEVGASSELAGLRELVETAARGGQPVRLELAPAAATAAPPGVAASVYRIVQESLTNARKHAGAAPVAVDVALDGPDWLVVIVSNAPPRPEAPRAPVAGAGRGITGMTERARLLGGELRAAPTDDGGFAVLARLPLAGERVRATA